MRASGLDDLSHLVQENGEVLWSARQERDEAKNACSDSYNNDRGEQSDCDDLTCAAPDEGAGVAWGEDMDELVDQQSSQQGREQTKPEGNKENEPGEDLRGEIKLRAAVDTPVSRRSLPRYTTAFNRIMHGSAQPFYTVGS
jgi:hypothetical protein